MLIFILLVLNWSKSYEYFKIFFFSFHDLLDLLLTSYTHILCIYPNTEDACGGNVNKVKWTKENVICRTIHKASRCPVILDEGARISRTVKKLTVSKHYKHWLMRVHKYSLNREISQQQLRTLPLKRAELACVTGYDTRSKRSGFIYRESDWVDNGCGFVFLHANDSS